MHLKDVTKETAYSAIKKLVERFQENYDSYKNQSYNETQTRVDFINPFFKALGWDMDNEQGASETYREVIHEDKLKIGESNKAPDYCFTVAGQKKLFYVEAKKPSVVIKDDISPAYQVRRYGWSAKLLISVVTDFEELAIYDTTHKPNPKDNASVARVKYLTYTQYLDEFDFLWETFAQEGIRKGRFDKYSLNDAKKRGTSTVDKEFIKSLDVWREELAKNIVSRNKEDGFAEEHINYAVQNILDRIIFLRICEDRGIEPYGRLQALLKEEEVYKKLGKYFLVADDRYNSGLFRFKKDKNNPQNLVDDITLKLSLDDKVLKKVIKELYYPESPFQFSEIPIEILGQAYEQFLGKVIRITKGGMCKIEEKSEVRKAGGVYYTPEYIVNYIVKNTVGVLIEGKTPKEIDKIKIVDPACGSGSFLLGAYSYLLDYHLKFYTKNKTKHTLTPEGKLTTKEKKKILLNNIYGVDIDAQAVEVSKLSLLLKAIEGETEGSIKQELTLFHERVLPTLDNNIKCGNSLIGLDFYKYQLDIDINAIKKAKPFDWQQSFPEVFKQGGFDIAIGNPPYLKIEHIDKVTKSYLTDTYKTIMKRFDIYGLLLEKSVIILKEHGVLGMILPSTLLNNLSLSVLREYLIKHTNISTIVNLGSKVFEKVNNDTMIVLFSKTTKDKGNTTIFDFLAYGDNLLELKETESKDLKSTNPPNYVFEIRVSSKEQSIFNKMCSQGAKLSNFCEVFQGFVTGSNDAYIVDIETINKEQLEKTLFKKAVFGDEVARYSIPRPKYSVIYLNKTDELKKYPNIKARLEPYKGTLQNKREVKLGRQPWYSLHWPRNPLNFEKEEKILVQAIRNLSLKKRIVATIDNNKLYADHTLNVIYTPNNYHNLRFFLGIINSSTVNFMFSKKYLDINIKGVYLSDIPIPTEPETNPYYSKIIELVDGVLKLNKSLANAKTPSEKEQLQSLIIHSDKKIDELVYSIYGFTKEEIKIIENEAS